MVRLGIGAKNAIMVRDDGPLHTRPNRRNKSKRAKHKTQHSKSGLIAHNIALEKELSKLRMNTNLYVPPVRNKAPWCRYKCRYVCDPKHVKGRVNKPSIPRPTAPPYEDVNCIEEHERKHSAATNLEYWTVLHTEDNQLDHLSKLKFLYNGKDTDSISEDWICYKYMDDIVCKLRTSKDNLWHSYIVAPVMKTFR